MATHGSVGKESCVQPCILAPNMHLMQYWHTVLQLAWSLSSVAVLFCCFLMFFLGVGWGGGESDISLQACLIIKGEIFETNSVSSAEQSQQKQMYKCRHAASLTMVHHLCEK